MFHVEHFFGGLMKSFYLKNHKLFIGFLTFLFIFSFVTPLRTFADSVYSFGYNIGSGAETVSLPSGSSLLDYISSVSSISDPTFPFSDFSDLVESHNLTSFFDNYNFSSPEFYVNIYKRSVGNAYIYLVLFTKSNSSSSFVSSSQVSSGVYDFYFPYSSSIYYNGGISPVPIFPVFNYVRFGLSSAFSDGLYCCPPQPSNQSLNIVEFSQGGMSFTGSYQYVSDSVDLSDDFDFFLSNSTSFSYGIFVYNSSHYVLKNIGAHIYSPVICVFSSSSVFTNNSDTLIYSGSWAGTFYKYSLSYTGNPSDVFSDEFFSLGLSSTQALLPTPTPLPHRDASLPTPTPYPSSYITPAPTGEIIPYNPDLHLVYEPGSFDSNLVGVMNDFFGAFTNSVFFFSNYVAQMFFESSQYAIFIFIVPAGALLIFLLGRLHK